MSKAMLDLEAPGTNLAMLLFRDDGVDWSQFATEDRAKALF